MALQERHGKTNETINLCFCVCVYVFPAAMQRKAVIMAGGTELSGRGGVRQGPGQLS